MISTRVPHLSMLICIGLCFIAMTMSMNVKDVEKIVHLHNKIRRDVTPSASNMMEIKWSQDLAKLAQIQAEMGETDRKESLTYHARYGRNVFASDDKSINYNTAVLSWFKESKHYNKQTFSCSAKCSSFLQLVHASTKSFGCGDSGSQLVCLYSTDGDKQGVSPYKVGAACTGCRVNQICSNNLCREPKILIVAQAEEDSTTTIQETTLPGSTTHNGLSTPMESDNGTGGNSSMPTSGAAGGPSAGGFFIVAATLLGTFLM
jgi:hypothetical protein